MGLIPLIRLGAGGSEQTGCGADAAEVCAVLHNLAIRPLPTGAAAEHRLGAAPGSCPLKSPHPNSNPQHPPLSPPSCTPLPAEHRRVTMHINHVSAHVPLLMAQPSPLGRLRGAVLRRKVGGEGGGKGGKATHRQVRRRVGPATGRQVQGQRWSAGGDRRHASGTASTQAHCLQAAWPRPHRRPSPRRCCLTSAAACVPAR